MAKKSTNIPTIVRRVQSAFGRIAPKVLGDSFVPSDLLLVSYKIHPNPREVEMRHGEVWDEYLVDVWLEGGVKVRAWAFVNGDSFPTRYHVGSMKIRGTYWSLNEGFLNSKALERLSK